MKLAVVASHPIQYHAPLYRRLASESGLDLKVYFSYIPDAKRQSEGFGEAFVWDIPLTTGYNSEVFAPWLHGSKDVFGIIRAVAALRRLWKEDSPDCVFITGWHHPGMFAGMLAAESLKLPMIFRGEANLISPRAFWKKVIHKALLSRFTRILHIGAANLHYYQHFGVRESIFCPFFSDNERLVHDFGKLLPSRKSIREHWRIPESSTCFLFCGKLETKKRPADFIHAVEGVDGASGLVVGSGELENGIRSLSRKTVFAGFLNQTEIAKAYVAADVLVLPSDFGEVWGLVVNEAMACGLPAIVSDQVGCREDLVIEGVTGFSYPCGDVQALKAKIKRLASDEELRRVMSLNAQSRVTEIYNVENAARAVLKAVESLQC